jgi:hypothetical protein
MGGIRKDNLIYQTAGTFSLTNPITRCCSSSVMLEPEGKHKPEANNLSPMLSSSP